MKVLLVNGSSHVKGSTMVALEEMVKVFQEAGVETEIIQVGGKPIADCLQCMKCREIGKCIIPDQVNDFVAKAREADGFVFASPVYFAHPSGRLLSFLDRAFFSGEKDGISEPFAFKPGAAVAVARRAGLSASLDVINKYFGISQMPVAESTYWNMAHGMVAEEVPEDAEGLQTMRNLARNMIFLMESSKVAREHGVAYPKTETEAMTNFIR